MRPTNGSAPPVRSLLLAAALVAFSTNAVVSPASATQPTTSTARATRASLDIVDTERFRLDLREITVMKLSGDQAVMVPVYDLSAKRPPHIPAIPTTLRHLIDCYRYDTVLVYMVAEDESRSEAALVTEIVNVFGFISAGTIFNPFDENRAWIEPYASSPLLDLFAAGGLLSIRAEWDRVGMDRGQLAHDLMFTMRVEWEL